MIHTSQYLHWQTQTHSIPPKLKQFVYALFTQKPKTAAYAEA